MKHVIHLSIDVEVADYDDAIELADEIAQTVEDQFVFEVIGADVVQVS